MAITLLLPSAQIHHLGRTLRYKEPNNPVLSFIRIGDPVRALNHFFPLQHFQLVSANINLMTTKYRVDQISALPAVHVVVYFPQASALLVYLLPLWYTVV